MLIWTRGEDLKLSEHFHAREFECHCGRCIIQKVAPKLLKRLEDVRMLAKKRKPRLRVILVVLSAFRCKERQQRLRSMPLVKTAKKESTHERGEAADFYIPGFSTEELESLCEDAGFKSLGLADTFIHADLREDRARRRWSY